MLLEKNRPASSGANTHNLSSTGNGDFLVSDEETNDSAVVNDNVESTESIINQESSIGGEMLGNSQPWINVGKKR